MSTSTTDTLARANADPTRTTTLRRRYAQRLRGRFAAINTEIRAGVRDRDVFGLRDDRRTRRETLEPTPLPSQFPERRDRQLETFDRWLDRQLENEVLAAVGPNNNQFVRTAYARGLSHAESAARQAGHNVPAGGGVESVINRPIHRDELQLIYTRDYSELEGITTAVSQQSNRVLAEGLRSGAGPKQIARDLTDRVDKIGKTRATVLARTSIIDTFNAASLNRYEEMNVEGVSIEAEWQTAGDSRVCPICQALEGRTWTIQEARETRLDLSGQVPDDVSGASDVPVKPPAHPRCRCALIPA